MAEESLENQFLDTPGSAAGLRARVVRGGFWVFALRITTRLFGLARTIVLARLLAPADFGVFGIALLAMSALQTFSQTGFGAALIQKKGDTKSYLDTAWTVQVIRGGVLALIAFAIAPYVAAFFDAPEAKPILQVIAFSVLLGGFGNIGLIYFTKELEFHKTFVYTLSGTLADIGVAISAAFLLRSVWALVFGLLAGNVVRLVLSYFVHPYRPRLAFNKQQFKELFSFGKWIFWSHMIHFFILQGDDVFVGRFLGVTALGFYQIAYRIGNMPSTEYAKSIAHVAFPTYTKLQDNPGQLRKAYLETLQLTTFISIPFALGVFILAPDFTKIFLGEKWIPMIPALQILALAGLVRSITNTIGNVVLAVGKPQILTKWQFVRLIVLIVLLYPLTIRWGIAGASLAVLASNVISTIGFNVIVVRITKSEPITVIKEISIPLVNAVIMVVVIYILQTSIATANLWRFITSIVMGILTYSGATFLSAKLMKYGILCTIKNNLKALRRRPA